LNRVEICGIFFICLKERDVFLLNFEILIKIMGIDVCDYEIVTNYVYLSEQKYDKYNINYYHFQ